MRKFGPWCLLPCLQVLAFGVAAQQAYVAGGIGRAAYDFNDCGAEGCQRSAGAWRAAAGYRFNRAIALEGFHFDLGRARTSDPSLYGTFGGTAQGVQLLAGWQGDQVEVSGKIGLARARSDFRAGPASVYASTTATHTEWMGGLAAAWQVTPGVALRLDVDLVTLALESDALYYSRGANITSVVLGVMIRF